MDTPRDRFGNASANESGGQPVAGSVCPHCGQRINAGLEQFLGKLGLGEDVIDNIRNAINNADIEEHLNQAREYLRSNRGKAKEFAKENPGKMAAGIAILAIGAGLLINAAKR